MTNYRSTVRLSELQIILYKNKMQLISADTKTLFKCIDGK